MNAYHTYIYEINNVLEIEMYAFVKYQASHQLNTRKDKNVTVTVESLLININ